MRSEFQDVFKDAYDHWIDDACSHRYHASKSLALQVWQHQQSKVDEIERIIKLRDQQLTEEIGLSTKYVAKSDELQKRVDATLKVVQSMRNEVKHGHMSDEEVQMLSSFAEELEQALKGGS